MFCQKKNLHTLVLTLKSNADALKEIRFRNHVLISKVILFIICTLPFLLATLFTYLAYKEGSKFTYWTLGHEVENDISVAIIHFVGIYVHFTTYQEYPCLFALSICLLIHRYGLILLQINDIMKKQSMENSTFSAHYSKVVSRYNTLEKELHILKDTLSKPLFFVLSTCFCSLFMTLTVYLEYRTIPLFLILVILASNVLTSLTIVVCVAYFVTRIPEYMWKIKTEAGFLMDEHQALRKRSNEIDLLEIIRRKEILYLSAGGVYFKTSFLLTAFGTFFTYALLIATTK
ncbi:uncharacterized protein TNIN_354661 [Trichonephila inaurata madagascariensis]|uniref:Uncharacterized protein n=1 Tax=Trichonephila inaurata madagascariensis TaxID=2747483 RepID=A0A8X6YHP5_9ARAC|nr:uncharacterized protein TNIN_354661 [Trichonephila inaurata madagascariensis]